jgi:hypothetical protein
MFLRPGVGARIRARIPENVVSRIISYTDFVCDLPIH